MATANLGLTSGNRIFQDNRHRYWRRPLVNVRRESGNGQRDCPIAGRDRCDRIVILSGGPNPAEYALDARRRGRFPGAFAD